MMRELGWGGKRLERPMTKRELEVLAVAKFPDSSRILVRRLPAMRFDDGIAGRVQVRVHRVKAWRRRMRAFKRMLKSVLPKNEHIEAEAA